MLAWVCLGENGTLKKVLLALTLILFLSLTQMSVQALHNLTFPCYNSDTTFDPMHWVKGLTLMRARIISTQASANMVPSMKGMTLNAWSAEAYNSSDFDQSITNLANIKANWVTFTVFWFMESYTDTEMHPRLDLYTASNSSLIHAIQKAHELEMKVALKPMVDVIDGHWRGNIDPTNWTLWFENYRDFIGYYAGFAEENDVELFEVGTELRSSQSRESEWRQVISEVRTCFSGNITYAANWDSYSIYASLPGYAVKFWDALDYVGVDAYFPLTASYDPTVEQLVGGWSLAASGWWGSGRNWTNDLYSTYIQTGKEIIFTEIGYISQNGTNMQPWGGFSPPHEIDLQEQADCYQAALEVFKDKAWFEGWFWWNWETDPNAGGPSDNWYTPQNKPAETVLFEYYSARVHDVAIMSVAPSVSEAYVGQIVDIEVVVKNLGNVAETFNVTAKYDNTTIGTEKVTDLAPYTETTLVFTWNTTDVTPCINYIIKAEADVVQGEVETADNIFIDGSVKVKLLGDVNDDGIVDIYDLGRIGKAYGATLESSNWDADADINSDDIIDFFDLAACGKNYGKSC